MGQAKRRGNFETRKAEAIKAGRIYKNSTATSRKEIEKAAMQILINESPYGALFK